MRNLIIAILALSAAACTNTIGNEKLGSSQSKIDKQMKDASTKADVRDLYGSPSLMFKKDGNEVYEYSRVDGSGRHIWLVPIAGPIISLFQDDFSYDITALYVKFDAKDKIKNYDVVQASGTGN
ncbi:MAG: hypothetical protein LBH81_03860 [Rickettsiales bacterium]|jgi:hypothetical protein|nr:hypothetical protein [Rickettsiales bacterium]